MNLKFLITGCLAILMSGISLKAQSDTTLSLSLADAQEYAIENYYVTKNAERDIESAKKKIWETTAIGLPQVNGTARYEHVPGEIPEFSFGSDDPNSNDPFTQLFNGAINAGWIDPTTMGEGGGSQIAVPHNLTYTLSVNQLIFSGEYIVGLQASRTFLQLSEESYEKTSIAIKEMVAASYYTILILEKNAALLRETASNFIDIYNNTKKYAEQGLVENTEADQLAINVTRTNIQLKSIERQIEYMSNMLKYQLGLDVTDKLALTDDLEKLITSNLIDVHSKYIFNLEEHIDYRMLNTQEKVNELSLKREKSAYLPSLSAFYQYNDKLVESDVDFTINHILGVNVSVPIFSSGMKNARVKQAKIELEKSQLMKEQESQSLIMASEQARFDYLTAFETYNNELSNFDLSTRILNNTTEKYKQGMVSSMELTIANNQYLEAQLTMSSATLSLLNAKIALDKAYNKL